MAFVLFQFWLCPVTHADSLNSSSFHLHVVGVQKIEPIMIYFYNGVPYLDGNIWGTCMLPASFYMEYIIREFGM